MTELSVVFALTQLTEAADLLTQKVRNKRERVWRVSVSFVWKSQIKVNELSIKQGSDPKSVYLFSYLRRANQTTTWTTGTSHRRWQQAVAISKRQN